LKSPLGALWRYRLLAKSLLVQAVGLGTTYEQKRMEIHDRFDGLIGSYLQEAIEVGDIAPVDTEVVSYAWMGAIYNLVSRWVYTGEPTSQRILAALVPVLLQSVGYHDDE